MIDRLKVASKLFGSRLGKCDNSLKERRDSNPSSFIRKYECLPTINATTRKTAPDLYCRPVGSKGDFLHYPSRSALIAGKASKDQFGSSIRNAK